MLAEYQTITTTPLPSNQILSGRIEGLMGHEFQRKNAAVFQEPGYRQRATKLSAV